MLDYQKLGAVLKDNRSAAGFSQREVAEWFDITYQNVSSWERGASKIDIDSLLVLCDKYNINYSDLLDSVASSSSGKNVKKDASFGEQLVAIRESKGLTSAEVAGKIGMIYRTYLQYEQGELEPSLDMLYKIANVLNVPPGDLLTDTKKALAPDDESETRADKLIDLFYTLLVEGGYVREGQQLTSRQLDYVVAILNFVDLSFGEEQSGVATG